MMPRPTQLRYAAGEELRVQERSRLPWPTPRRCGRLTSARAPPPRASRDRSGDGHPVAAGAASEEGGRRQLQGRHLVQVVDVDLAGHRVGVDGGRDLSGGQPVVLHREVSAKSCSSSRVLSTWSDGRSKSATCTRPSVSRAPLSSHRCWATRAVSQAITEEAVVARGGPHDLVVIGLVSPRVRAIEHGVHARRLVPRLDQRAQAPASGPRLQADRLKEVATAFADAMQEQPGEDGDQEAPEDVVVGERDEVEEAVDHAEAIHAAEEEALTLVGPRWPAAGSSRRPGRARRRSARRARRGRLRSPAGTPATAAGPLRRGARSAERPA